MLKNKTQKTFQQTNPDQIKPQLSLKENCPCMHSCCTLSCPMVQLTEHQWQPRFPLDTDQLVLWNIYISDSKAFKRYFVHSLHVLKNIKQDTRIRPCWSTSASQPPSILSYLNIPDPLTFAGSLLRSCALWVAPASIKIWDSERVDIHKLWTLIHILALTAALLRIHVVDKTQDLDLKT